MTRLNRATIEMLAKQELQEEANRIAIDRMKLKLKSRKWWHKLLPFKVIIIRRK